MGDRQVPPTESNNDARGEIPVSTLGDISNDQPELWNDETVLVSPGDANIAANVLVINDNDDPREQTSANHWKTIAET